MSCPIAPGRKIIKRACDGCKIRKIKCSELPPCDGCIAAGIPCTFKKVQGIRGPRKLRPKTIEQITQRQKQSVDGGGNSTPSGSYSRDAGSTQCELPPANAAAAQGPQSNSTPSKTSVASLVLRLCVYRLRLFPVWPIVAVEDIMASLQRDEGNEETYALANAVGAATMAQLKLDSPSDSATSSSMEAECQRAKALKKDGQQASLNTLRIAFFLHVYHENQEAGGVQSLLYLREAITLAQIMGLHRESTYATLSASEQEIRRRIIWLLFVTERGVAMLHNLPVVLKCNTNFPSTDGDDGSHVFPAFRKLVNLFWIFDQSGAFDILQNTDAENLNGFISPHQNSLDILQQRLQDVPIDWESSNDVQRADICVTRQWMRAVLWRASLNRSSNVDQVNSLSHPIQIAQEFLAVISKLPTTAIEAHGSGIEFKIYEIASAVADAMTSNLRNWMPSDNAREILNQFHRILSSCRGGNLTLASMLCLKIAQIQDQQPLLLEPSSRVEELNEEWPDHTTTTTGLHFEFGFLPRLGPPSPLRSLRTHGKAAEDESSARERPNRASDLDLGQTQRFTDAQELSWTSTIGEELTSALSSSSDLYEQLQNFDGSFEGFQPDSLDPLLLDHDMLQRVAGDGFSHILPLSSVFSQ